MHKTTDLAENPVKEYKKCLFTIPKTKKIDLFRKFLYNSFTGVTLSNRILTDRHTKNPKKDLKFYDISTNVKKISYS